MGFFFDFLEDPGVTHDGRRGGRLGIRTGEHAARFAGGKLGVLQGCKTFILQDADGQIELTHSVSAGLDYAAVGPEHAFYRDLGRIGYTYATDDEVLEAFQLCAAAGGDHPGARELPCAGARAQARPGLGAGKGRHHQPERPGRQGCAAGRRLLGKAAP
jgi:tryptophan synthase beta chain